MGPCSEVVCSFHELRLLCKLNVPTAKDVTLFNLFLEIFGAANKHCNRAMLAPCVCTKLILQTKKWFAGYGSKG
jgi:hypothetical protein